MTYPWPTDNADATLQKALDIAMNYLSYTGLAIQVVEIEPVCAAIILTAWRHGIRHPNSLADCAVNAVEQPAENGKLALFRPPTS
jgi:hypothetical protein